MPGGVAAGTPVPLKLTVCGLLLALSYINNDELRGPVALGLNVTAIVQFAPTARLAPQVFVW